MSEESKAADRAPSAITADREETGVWKPWHTLALFALTAFSVFMAGWRPFGIYVGWLVVMLTVLLFTLVAGHGIKGVWRGAFIDERNKISLSRFQMLVWTIVVVSAFGTIVIARSHADPFTAMDIKVPVTVWLLMGISTTSLVGSPLIKNSKMERQLALKEEVEKKRMADQGVDPDKVRTEGQIVFNRTVRDASWKDLFTGEEVSNVNFLDLAKIQMFFFTVLLVLSYSVQIGVSLRGDSIPNYLPDIGDGMLALLGISHSGYLVTKALPAPKQPASETAGREGG